MEGIRINVGGFSSAGDLQGNGRASFDARDREPFGASYLWKISSSNEDVLGEKSETAP